MTVILTAETHVTHSKQIGKTKTNEILHTPIIFQ